VSSIRAGLLIDAGSVSIVAMNKGAMVFHERRVSDRASTMEHIRALIARVPIGRLDRMTVSVVLSPTFAQLRLLTGLPGGLALETARRLVEENSERFFLGSSTRLAIATPISLEDGFIAGAFESDIIDGIRALQDRRIIHVGTASSVLAGAMMRAGDLIAWQFEDASIRVNIRGGKAVSAHRSMRDEHAVSVFAELVPTVVRVGPEFAAAFGAAVSDWNTVPHLNRRDLSGEAGRPHRGVRAACVAAVIVSFLALLFAPGVVAARVTKNADARERDQHIVLARVSSAAAQARERSAVERHAHEFNGTRRSMLQLLGAVTNVLPESTAVASVRVDSLAGTITILSPHSMPAVRALADAPQFEAMRVAGPIMHENSGGRELERVTVRFRLRKPRARR
jgi:hypothetical protein